MKKKLGMDIFEGKRDFEEGFHTVLIFEEITTPFHNIIFINVSLPPLRKRFYRKKEIQIVLLQSGGAR